MKKSAGGGVNWEQSEAEQGSQTAADVREQEGSEEEDEKQGNMRVRPGSSCPFLCLYLPPPSSLQARLHPDHVAQQPRQHHS